MRNPSYLQKILTDTSIATNIWQFVIVLRGWQFFSNIISFKKLYILRLNLILMIKCKYNGKYIFLLYFLEKSCFQKRKICTAEGWTQNFISGRVKHMNIMLNCVYIFYVCRSIHTFVVYTCTYTRRRNTEMTMLWWRIDLPYNLSPGSPLLQSIKSVIKSKSLVQSILN